MTSCWACLPGEGCLFLGGKPLTFKLRRWRAALNRAWIEAGAVEDEDNGRSWCKGEGSEVIWLHVIGFDVSGFDAMGVKFVLDETVSGMRPSLRAWVP